MWGRLDGMSPMFWGLLLLLSPILPMVCIVMIILTTINKLGGNNGAG